VQVTVHRPGRITPVHRAAEGITTRTIRELVYSALQRIGPVPEELPPDALDGESLVDEATALPNYLARGFEKYREETYEIPA